MLPAYCARAATNVTRFGRCVFGQKDTVVLCLFCDVLICENWGGNSD